MSSSGARIALLGATGAVGSEILQVLDEREFPVRELLAYASLEREGDELEFRGDAYKLRRVSAGELVDADLVFAAAPGVLSELLPGLRAAKVRLVDASGALEAETDSTLFLPGVTPPLARETRLVSVVRGVSAGLGIALAPLVRASLLKSVSAVTLESASSAGIHGVRELAEHTAEVLNRMSGERPESEIFAQSLAFDCLPQIGALTASGDTTEELAAQSVLARLLGLPAHTLALTRVRVPALSGSLAIANVELTRASDLDELRELLAAQPGIRLLDDQELPTPRSSLGHDDVALGRLRAADRRLAFVLALNDLRLGAALPAVAAAEALLR